MYYLKMDVLTLEGAMEKYRNLIMEITDLDVHNYLTISSIGQSYVISKGCYDNCVKVSSSLRQYIQLAIKGGRVYIPDSNKGQVFGSDSNPVADFDGVSLYLSAMKEVPGIPMGLIKKGLVDTNYDEKTHYIIRSKIKKINKTQSVPMISYNNTDGTIKYTNNINEVFDKILTIDKTTHEDFIKFHQIEYDIIDGIYWDEGYNTKIKEIAQHLHLERCKYKKTNVPLAKCLKLIGNSIYGKSGIRKSDTKTVFVSKIAFNKYVSDHWGLISEIQETPFNYKIIKSNFDMSFNRNYIACSILSQSKRIMQQVFNCFDNEKKQVFYTDTDSIHCLKKDIEIIAENYKKEYNREIIGNDLGQFHNDFEMNNCKNVDSVYHQPIGTKCYIDVLRGIDVNTNKFKYDLHLRLKGVSSLGMDERIKCEMKTLKCDRIDAAKSIYKKLSNKEGIRFTMKPSFNNPSFIFDKDGVKTRETGQFIRCVRFN
ncbi:hypothetical protein T492DRAFT_606813 [Pavlovales sp. CCMP2436]|nr:hypothetical protein T492DRAFT_606813 [Pavlovales sp. CCMP2436]